MIIEVKCKESQASTWIVAGMNRRYTSKEYFEENFELICLEVAEELRMTYELKQDGTLLFQDKLQ